MSEQERLNKMRNIVIERDKYIVFPLFCAENLFNSIEQGKERIDENGLVIPLNLDI